MLDCPRCGLTNRPYETDCDICLTPLQDADAAAAKRLEWDALPGPVREEYERSIRSGRERLEDHRRWLKRHRITHAILGGMLLNLGMNGSVLFLSPWSVPVDLVLGGSAALVLNWMRGGAYRAIGLFTVAIILSVILRAPFMGWAYAAGWWLITAVAVAFVLCGAYYLGLKMEFEHVERNII